jgi:hypothetical protein
MMLRLYKSLNERDRRRYAAIESIKLGHGGITYISQVLQCDPKTIHAGLREIDIPEEAPSPEENAAPVKVKEETEVKETERLRKKGLDASQ